jgi:hypothetical protein
VVTAGAMIFGDVQENYREFPSEQHYQDDKKVQHTLYLLRGEFHVRANFKVVDVATGRLIVAKTYEEKREDTNRGQPDRRPDPVDRDGLTRAGRAAVVDHFMKAIVPHQEFMVANFKKDGDIPQLEGGIGWAERGDWKKAQDAFNDGVGSAEKNVKLKSGQVGSAYWDLGLSYEYAGDYDKASDMINKAYTLTNDKDMLGELDNIKGLQADAKRLAEQSGGEAQGAK